MTTKSKITVGCVFLHLFLICAGFVTSFQILSVVKDSQTSPLVPSGTDRQKFYLLMTQYAYSLTPSGMDDEFRDGMKPDERQKFQTILNAIRYKEDCTKEKSWSVDNATNCSVNGRVIDYIQYGQYGQ